MSELSTLLGVLATLAAILMFIRVKKLKRKATRAMDDDRHRRNGC